MSQSRKSKTKRFIGKSEPAPSAEPVEQEALQSDLSPAWMIGASVLIILQMLVVTAEPLRFFTSSSRGNSPATDPVRDRLAPWVEFGYMNHGYFFFAPEPGPSHLLDFRFENEDGPVRIRFPDRKAQWPRLLYHRHFMLTENLNQLWVPPVDPGLSPSDPLAEPWRLDRGRYTLVRNSMCAHVGAAFGALGDVEVDRIVHELPLLDDVMAGDITLQDPRLYVTLPDSFVDPGMTNPAANSPELPPTVPPNQAPLSVPMQDDSVISSEGAGR